MSPPPAENFAARIFMGPALRAQPDRRLVDLVRDGYDAAFEEIVRRYRRPLDRFAAAIVGGRSEDVTQDAFSKALLALRGTETEIELRPWLYRIVRNTALNDLRDRAPEAAELSEALPGGRSAAAEVEAREELTELMERLRALPEPQRAALVMRELEGLSHEEIAAALGVSGGAARQAIYRARAALREGLGLLVPMPVVRVLAEQGDAATGGAIAGASTAGGAALGGLGGGAVKAGVATLLVAGAVGAGVAVDHRQGERAGPEQAEAAPLVERPATSAGSGAGGGSGSGGSGEDSSGHGQGEDHGGDDRRGEGSDDNRDLADENHSGSNSGSGGSGRSGHSGSGSHSGRGENSGPGSISSGHGSGDDDDGDDHSGHGSGGDDDDHSGSDSGSSGSGDDGGSSGSGSGSGDSGSGSSGGDDGGSSGPGSGDPEPETTPEPDVEEEPVDDNSGSGSESSGSGSGELDGLD